MFEFDVYSLPIFPGLYAPVRYDAHDTFGIHLLHAHFQVAEGSVLYSIQVQISGNSESCWTKPISAKQLATRSTHGRIPCEVQEREPPSRDETWRPRSVCAGEVDHRLVITLPQLTTLLFQFWTKQDRHLAWRLLPISGLFRRRPRQTDEDYSQWPESDAER